MRRKILDGVDGLITNYPARLTAVLERLEQARDFHRDDQESSARHS
jgi:hypothetical protein